MLLRWGIANCIRILIYWHVAVLMCWYINMLLYWYIDLRWHRDPAPMLHRHIDVLMYASKSFRCFVDMIPHWAICVMTVTVSPYYITSVFVMTWWLTMTHLIWILLIRNMWSTPRNEQVCINVQMTSGSLPCGKSVLWGASWRSNSHIMRLQLHQFSSSGTCYVDIPDDVLCLL